MDRLRFERWPEDLRAVFAAIGQAMAGGRLTPDIIDRLPRDAGILAGHTVSVTHQPGSSGRQRGRFTITIAGPRTRGAWTFRTGELEAMAQRAAGAA